MKIPVLSPAPVGPSIVNGNKHIKQLTNGDFEVTYCCPSTNSSAQSPAG